MATWNGDGWFDMRAGWRRTKPAQTQGSRDPVAEPTSRTTTPPWMEPFPDTLLDEEPVQTWPAVRYEPARSMQLSFIAALQRLPPAHRAALVLCDVRGFSLADAADILDTSRAAVTAALRSGRAALTDHLASSGRQQAVPSAVGVGVLAERFAAALERGDLDQLAALLTHDVRLSMPPATYDHLGQSEVTASLGRYCVGHDRMRLVPTKANGQPAFGCYTADSPARIAHLNSLMVLTLQGERISALTRFLGITRCEDFGLPATIPAD